MNKLTEQQKVELGEAILEKVNNFELVPFVREDLAQIAEFAINKIQELTQNSENIKEIVKNPSSDDTESSRFLLNNDKQHICCVCGQSYPESELERNFMVCDKCKSEGRAIPAREDKNGNLFAAGDWLKDENSSRMTQVLCIQPETIIYGFTSGPPCCFYTQDFIDADWIVHERVTPYRTIDGGQCIDPCKFNQGELIGSMRFCKTQCGHNKDYDSKQHWVICELYNKEFYEQSQQSPN